MTAARPEPVDDEPHGPWAAAPVDRGWPWMRAAAAMLLLLTMHAAAGVLVPLVSAAVMFLLLSAPAEALQRRGVPAVIAAAVLVFAPLLLLAGVGALGWPAADAWWRAMPQRVEALGTLLAGAGVGADLVGAVRRGLGALAGGQDAGASPGTWMLAGALGIATASMLVFFLLLAQRSLLTALLDALPAPSARQRLVAAARATRAGIATYFRTMLIVNAGVGAATGAVLAALGWADAGVWAAVIALLLFVPYLGPLALAMLLSAAGRDHASGLAALAPAGAFLLLHAIEANVVSPMLMGWQLRLGRPALVVAVMLGGWAWGVAGGVLAVPLLIAWRAALGGGARAPLLKALLDAERDDAPPLDAARVEPEVDARADAGRVRQMPRRDASAPPCTSPSSPRATHPKSTASR